MSSKQWLLIYVQPLSSPKENRVQSHFLKATSLESNENWTVSCVKHLESYQCDISCFSIWPWNSYLTLWQTDMAMGKPKKYTPICKLGMEQEMFLSSWNIHYIKTIWCNISNSQNWTPWPGYQQTAWRCQSLIILDSEYPNPKNGGLIKSFYHEMTKYQYPQHFDLSEQTSCHTLTKNQQIHSCTCPLKSSAICFSSKRFFHFFASQFCQPPFYQERHPYWSHTWKIMPQRSHFFTSSLVLCHRRGELRIECDVQLGFMFFLLNVHGMSWIWEIFLW